MKRSFSSFGLAVFLFAILVLTTTVWAGTFRSPNKDIACDVGGTCWNDSGIYLSTSASGTGGCKDTPDWIGYINWDLTGNTSDAWKSAALTLTVHSTSGGTQPFTFTLYGVNDTSWNETNNSPDPGYDALTVLGTATADVSATDSPIVFEDDETNKMGTYFLGKKGGQASIAVALTGGCASVGSITATIEDHEGHGGSAPESGNEADLVFWTGTGVTAVSLASSQAKTTNWPVMAGLAALLVLVVAGLGFGVRRFNA